MIQMIQMGANEDVVAATVPGNKDRHPIRSDEYVKFYAKLDSFYKKNDSLRVVDEVTVFPPVDLSTYWNMPDMKNPPACGVTSASVAKASSNSSYVVPFNYENNFMLLGDTYAATYIKEGDENAKLSPEIKGLITEAYEAVKRSPVFGDWIYGDRINKRLEYLENIV